MVVGAEVQRAEIDCQIRLGWSLLLERSLSCSQYGKEFVPGVDVRWRRLENVFWMYKVMMTEMTKIRLINKTTSIM